MEAKRKGELIAFPKCIAPGRGRTSASHRRLFELLDSILPANSLNPTGMSECELRFFALRSHIDEVVSLASVHPRTIQQHYFDEQYLSLVSWFVLRALHKVALWNTLPLKRARLRITTIDKREHFAIEIKGPKSSVGRLDVSVPIEKAAFYALLPFCESGSNTKLRYVVDTPLGKTGDAHVETHIDMLLAAGDGDECLEPGVIEGSGNALPFVLIELELLHLDSAPLILENSQAIPILRNAIPLWREKKSIRQPFSAVRLVREGISPELKRAVRLLARRCELQRTLTGRH